MIYFLPKTSNFRKFQLQYKGIYQHHQKSIFSFSTCNSTTIRWFQMLINRKAHTITSWQRTILMLSSSIAQMYIMLLSTIRKNSIIISLNLTACLSMMTRFIVFRTKTCTVLMNQQAFSLCRPSTSKKSCGFYIECNAKRPKEIQTYLWLPKQATKYWIRS